MFKKLMRFLLISGILFAGLAAYLWFGQVKKQLNIEGDQKYFYLHSNANFNETIAALKKQGIVKNPTFFKYYASLRSLENNIYPGRYTLKKGQNNNDLLLMLRQGKIDEVKVIFHNVKNIEQLSKQVAQYIEASEDELLNVFSNPETQQRLGFNQNTFISLFLPNTYRFYWNTSAEEFLQRMQEEYKDFWNADRKAKARSLGLSQSEVYTLASIVQSEQANVEEEWPTIAGLYINRIRKGMKLQSDPTVIYAVGDFSIRRVLNKHLLYDSPYNTYKYSGLPPGPIRISSTKAIDAVLNYKDHNYLYMCAKPNSGGKHAFTHSYAQHLRNARVWTNHLNKQKILR